MAEPLSPEHTAQHLTAAHLAAWKAGHVSAEQFFELTKTLLGGRYGAELAEPGISRVASIVAPAPVRTTSK